jgi:hypothetical protein
MFTETLFVPKNRVLATIRVTVGWLILALCWTVYAWIRYSFFQNLAGLGISTLLYAAVVGVMWVAEQGRTLALTVLTTLGWLSFALYWIGFAWRQHTLLLNGAVLIGSLLLGLGILAALRLRGLPRDGWC